MQLILTQAQAAASHAAQTIDDRRDTQENFSSDHNCLAQLATTVRAPLAEFLNAHPEVAEALRPAWKRIDERWREAVRRDALSRARPISYAATGPPKSEP